MTCGMAMVTQASRSVSGVPAFQRAVCVPTCAVNTTSAPLSWNCASDSPQAFSPDWKSPEILKTRSAAREGGAGNEQRGEGDQMGASHADPRGAIWS